MEFWFGNMKAEGGWVGPVAGQASGFRAFKLIQACKGCFGLTASNSRSIKDSGLSVALRASNMIDVVSCKRF